MEDLNQFVLEPGVIPPQFIKREIESNKIIEEFSSPSPSSHSYAILGPRGCGKTVLLNYIVEKLDNREGWICANLNSKDDLLLQLAGALEDKTAMRFPKLQAEFSFSFSFMSLSLKGKEKVADIHALLRRMMETLHKHNYRVLVAIDDISLNEYVETFIKEFQLLRGQRFPIFLLTTGLYSAFNKIEEKDGITFLQRSPKCYLGPLNMIQIKNSYRQVLKISDEKAAKLASFTKGYAFAYQVLGYLLMKYNKKEIDEDIESMFDYFLEEGVYSRLYDELPKKEKEVVLYLSRNGESTNESLIASGVLNKDNISYYKTSLAKRGVCDTSIRGRIDLALPRFAEYVLNR